jgi:hypothetical protein
VICVLHTSPIKIPAGLFIDVDKLILNSLGKAKKLEFCGRIIKLLGFRIYFIAIAFRRVLCGIVRGMNV